MPGARMKARLRRLEQVVGVDSCPACRDRRGRLVVLRSFHESPNSAVESLGEEPPPCALCGEVPEEVVRIARTVVRSREEAIQRGAGSFDSEPESDSSTP
jgi:hypothetical protein